VTTPPTTILLISGSLRSGSTNAAVLQTAQAIAPAGVDAIIYSGLASLPHFNPDLDADPLPPAAAAFRDQLSAVDAVLFSTPEYAGALPGSLKNLLDWTVGDAASSGMPVGWINASARHGGATGAHHELHVVVTYTDWSVIDAACVALPVTRSDIGADGLLNSPALRDAIAVSLAALVDAVSDRRSPPG